MTSSLRPSRSRLANPLATAAMRTEHSSVSAVHTVGQGVEPPIFRLSGVAAVQAGSEDQACQAVRVHARSPGAAVVAVRVAVMRASWITSECRSHARGPSHLRWQHFALTVIIVP
jgi:hypothetical protein